MPILQSRLLRLIQAAEIFLRRDQVLRLHLVEICKMQISNEEFKARILAEVMSAPQYHPAELVIAEERLRYNQNASRNEKEAARMRAKRGGVPMQEYVHIPRRRQEPLPREEKSLIAQRHQDEDQAELDATTAWLAEEENIKLTPQQEAENEALLKSLRERHRLEDEIKGIKRKEIEE